MSGLSYTWDGTMWKMGVSAAATNPYVLKTGDAMAGALVLAALIRPRRRWRPTRLTWTG